MIRDPSDGSVRERPVLDTATTGLAHAVTPQQAEERARLDRSRQWLSKYRTNPERVARMTGRATCKKTLQVGTLRHDPTHPPPVPGMRSLGQGRSQQGYC